MKNKLIVLSSTVLGFPFSALAQNSAGCGSATVQLGTIQSIICTIGNILDTAIPVLVVLGVLYFVWGVVQYVISSDEEAKKAGKNRIIFGIIGIVVIVALWGIVGIVTRTFSLNGSATVNVPTVPF